MYGITFFVNATESLVCRHKYKNILVQLVNSNDGNIKFDEKIRHMTKKYGILITVSVLFHVVPTIAYFVLTLKQKSSSITYVLFIILRIYQYIIVTDVIKAKLEILLEQVLMIEDMEKHDWKLFNTKVVHLKKSYEQILGTVTLFNESTGYSLLSILIMIIFSLVCVTYWILLSLLKNVQVISMLCKDRHLYKTDVFCRETLFRFFALDDTNDCISL